MKWTCPKCQFEFVQDDKVKFKFCPNCGNHLETPETNRSEVTETESIIKKESCIHCHSPIEKTDGQTIIFCPYCGQKWNKKPLDSKKQSFFRQFFCRIFSFTGRASDLEFRLTIAFIAIVVLIIFFLVVIGDLKVTDGGLFGEFKTVEDAMKIAAVCFIIAAIPVSIRRLHDMGRSAWWYPVFSLIWIFGCFFILVQGTECWGGGDHHSNKYGAQPKEVDTFSYKSISVLLLSFGLPEKLTGFLAGLIIMLGVSLWFLCIIVGLILVVFRLAEKFGIKIS